MNWKVTRCNSDRLIPHQATRDVFPLECSKFGFLFPCSDFDSFFPCSPEEPPPFPPAVPILFFRCATPQCGMAHVFCVLFSAVLPPAPCFLPIDPSPDVFGFACFKPWRWAPFTVWRRKAQPDSKKTRRNPKTGRWEKKRKGGGVPKTKPKATAFKPNEMGWKCQKQ